MSSEAFELGRSTGARWEAQLKGSLQTSYEFEASLVFACLWRSAEGHNNNIIW